jgi:hypothetical protein
VHICKTKVSSFFNSWLLKVLVSIGLLEYFPVALSYVSVFPRFRFFNTKFPEQSKHKKTARKKGGKKEKN